MLRPWLARQAYSLLLRLGTPFYLWRLWSRGRTEPLYRAVWWERFGWYGPSYRAQLKGDPARPLIWLHAVSLGETRAMVPLINALREQKPGMRLLLTHGTATGREAGAALLQSGDVQTWFPYDTPGAASRFMRVHKPAVGILAETEVWPNVQHAASQAGVPMVLANARLSEKSLRQGLRFASLMRPAAHTLTKVLAQTQDDASRLTEMGAPRVLVCGNVKFDMTPSQALLDKGAAWRAADERPIVLAAITREGEEAGLLQAWLDLRATHDGRDGAVLPRLWIVPRHPQRFDEVANLIKQSGLGLSRRSAWPNGLPTGQALAADVWLGDSLGEMPAYYAAARVALLGGSFAPLGGHNLIEAAACGCPLIMGPSTFNFADAAILSLEAGASVRVNGWVDGVSTAIGFCNSEISEVMSEKSLLFSQKHRGVAQKMATEVLASASP